MCGVAGIAHFDFQNPVDLEPFNSLTDVLKHRGPDDDGTEVFFDGNVGLAHTRLSILDLSRAGHQPMVSDSRDVALVFNGEIYNYQELQAQLRHQGMQFQSRSDTEVLMKGYQVWGIEVVERLKGMFSFAIWDQQQQALYCARDRLGQKPLYYHYDSVKKTFLFASEMKALLCWPWVQREISSEALHCYFSLGYIPAPLSMLRGVEKVRAGHWIRVSEKGVSEKRYWSSSSSPKWKASEKEYTVAIREAVETSVRRRLVSDAPLGAFLSGGVDSTLVVSLMAKELREPVKTFTASFDIGPRSFKYNVDADMADSHAKAIGADHSRLQIKAKHKEELFKTLQQVVWHCDEPLANPTAVTTLLLSELVKQRGVKVILSGDGSDELFSGYRRYVAHRRLTLFQSLPKAVQAVFRGSVGMFPNGARAQHFLRKAELPERSPARYLSMWNQFTESERATFLTEDFQQGYLAPESVVSSCFEFLSEVDDRSLLNQTDLALWIADESNMRVDKMGMAHGVEIREPFLDHELVELAFSIPLEKQATWLSGKRLLKKAFADLLPEDVSKRSKWGWISPVYYWVNDVFWDEAQSITEELISEGIVTSDVRSLFVTRPSHSPQKIWSLLILGIWCKTYLWGESLMSGHSVDLHPMAYNANS